jgi:acyl transferase domain-containing protein/SAM-dependent methyltransferase/acyl carrier protein/NADP-dependent 3-hydroxy acid dehydrogenase YdfG
MRAKLEALQRAKSQPIAIVGMACRFPGEANSPQQYWDLLKAGRDAITEVPAGRFGDDGTRKLEEAGVPALRWGGFLDHVDQFDPSFFGIAPREAVAMDPQQRILLEVTWEALEAGGFPKPRLAGSRTGVFVGMCSHSVDYYMLQKDLLSPGSPYVGTGTSHNVVAGRLSYWFDWRAPSIAVDAACASSLMAVHLAVQSLRAGECDLCVAAGVNVLLAPEFAIHASHMDMLAPDGRCKPFDERADGFVRSDGCGVVLLKRLAEAQADGNRILAVIRASAANHDGHSNGLTAPNGLSQQAVIRAALEQANVSPGAVEYIETHGTGTGLGDPIEAESLSAVLGDGREAPCAIGSAKANIGHTEGAAGIAGLIKTVLSLQREAIPPLCHFRRLSPHISMRKGFVFPTRLQPWPRGTRPRYAGVSAFGWSGTNVHVVLEEAPLEPAQKASNLLRTGPLALPLSAHDEPSLRALATSYQQFLSRQANNSLWDICYTAAVARTHHAHRLVVFGETPAEMATKLRTFADNESSPITYGKADPNTEPGLAFVFPDETKPAGSVWALLEKYDVFANTVKECSQIAASLAECELANLLRAGDTDWQALAPEVANLAAFAIQAGLADLLQSWSCRPKAVVGCGLGEITAAYCAGVLSLADATRMVFYRVKTAGRAADISSPAQTGKAFANLSVQAPALPIYSGHTGKRLAQDSFVSEYCAANVYNPVITAQAVRQMIEDGQSLFLEVSLRKTSSLPQETVAAAGANATWIGTGTGTEAEPDPLCGVGALYVHGYTVDWGRVYPAGQQVDLPSYPWQRKRYWFQESSGRSRREASTPEMLPANGSAKDWFYRMSWEEKPVPLADGSNPREALESLAQDYAASALRALGFHFDVGATFAESELFARLGIVEKYRRLFHRMVAILEEGKYLSRLAEGWTVARAPVLDLPSDSPTDAGSYPAYEQEFGLLMRCGQALPQILRGAGDPLELLFPAESDISATMLYRKSVSLRFYNELAANLVRRSARERAERPLRILEVGAGSGATTACVLQQLSHEDIDYTVTDISPTLLQKAAALLPGNNSVRYAALDIESDPAIQGFAAHTFDFVVCANVLHATKDLSRTLSHLRQLLKKDGWLLLLEATAPRAWVDLTFGLTEGWWRFADTDLRPSYPLLSAQRWIDLLRAAGFPQCEALGSAYSHGAALEESIVAARPEATQASMTGRRERWAVFADDSGLGAQIAKQLQARKHECVLVRHGGAEGAIDPAIPGDYIRFFANQPAFDGVVHLWNLDIPANSAFTLDAIEAVQTLGLGSIVNIVRALDGRAAKVWMVTRHAQPMSECNAPASLGQAPAWGLGRGLAIEELERWGGLIDVDDSDPATIAEGVAREICDPDGEDQIALRRSRRYVARLLRATEPPPSPIKFRKDASYLITGGLGGLGRKLAVWMAQRGAGHLVLIGRSGVPERAEWDRLSENDPLRATVNAIRMAERCGAEVTVQRIDVGSPESVSTLLHQIGLSGRPLAGVIHCATAIDFRPLTALDSAAWQIMLRAKACGAWILHELTRTLSLDFFILFSSAACQLGAKNLAHYAAANLFLDGLASYRRSLNLPALAVAWGEWDDTASLTKEQHEFFQRSGLVAMDSNLAFPAMFQLAAAGVEQRMVADIDADLLKPAFELWGRRPFLDYLGAEIPVARESVKPVATAAPPPSESPALPSPALSLADMAPEDRRELVAGIVLREIAQVLGIDVPESIDPERGLFDMGMDSLMAVQLRKRLEVTFGRTLPKMLTFTYPTAAALTRYFLGDSAERDKTPPTRKAAASSSLVSQANDFSGADARKALMQELESLPPELKG